MLAFGQITEREFQELFPGQVVRVGMVHDTSDLDPLVKEYNQLKRKLEDLLDDYLGRKKRLLKIKRRKVSLTEHVQSRLLFAATCQNYT